MIRGLLLGVLLTILAGAGLWLAVAYGGFYNVAASSPDPGALRWTLDSAMRRSVSRQAGATRMPVSVPDETLQAGARRYAETCAQCHGAPGAEAAPWSAGMTPEPPPLTTAAAAWSPEEVAWIVENGIRMSGMPAFAGHLAPEEIIAVAAFVRELPRLSPGDYSGMAGPAAASSSFGGP